VVTRPDRSAARRDAAPSSARYPSAAIVICCPVRAGGLGGADPAAELGALRLKPWIEAAKKRLHHNVLAIALANKLARIAWAVLNKERNFEVTRTTASSSQPA
jgi:hypothetical protein